VLEFKGSFMQQVNQTTESESASTVSAIYSYEDRFGVLQYQVVRLEPKAFFQRRPDGNGGFVNDLNGVERVPYRLPRILSSTFEVIFVTEGEKDSDTLDGLGLIATTAASGVWTQEMIAFLAGRDVAILIDNDGIGLVKGDDLAKKLYGTAKSIRVVWLPGPKGSDVTDWFGAAHTVEELHKIVGETPLMQAPASYADADGWGEPLDLRPELPSVPVFDIHWLPECLRPLVEEVSESMQVPVDFPAATITVALAGITGRRISLRPKYKDSSWKMPSVLWGCLIGPPGSLKTPVLERIVQPLVEIEKEWRAIEALDVETYETAKAQRDIEQQVWESEVKAAIKSNQPQPPRPEGTLLEPEKRRILVTDANYESLHVILKANPAGTFCVRDELSGWLAGLEQDNRAMERPFWLSLWNGSGHYAIDRITRGNVYVPDMCGSIFGNLVPTSAARLVAAVANGKQDDGFLERFSFAVWPDIGSWKYIDRQTQPSAAQRWERVVRAIVALSGTDPLPMNFNPAAQEIFVNWISNLHKKLGADSLLHPAMQSLLAKYPKTLVVIAGIYQLAEMADSGELLSRAAIVEPYTERVRPSRRIVLPHQPNQLPPAPVESTLISVQNIRRAIEIVNYLEAHAHRLYSCVITPQLSASHNLARHLRRGDLDPKFSKRDIQRRNWTGLQEAELIEAAINHVADLHWIRPVPAPTTEKGGRPTIQYEINPRLK